MRDVFAAQRRKIARFLATGRKIDGDPLPDSWPAWDDFGLGNLDVAGRMTPLLELIWDAAATKFASRVGLDPSEWEVVNPHTRQMIEDAALAFAESTNETTSLEIEEALRRTREELIAGVVTRGEALPKLTKRINAIFDKAETWRARRIAQTEASRAVHAAQEQAAIESGVVVGWKWLLSSDACPLCNTVARRTPAVRLGQPFAIIGDNPHYSEVRFPPLHPHCNCTVVEILDTDEHEAFGQTLVQPEPEAADIDEPNVTTRIPVGAAL
jgi:hypothetical protein